MSQVVSELDAADEQRPEAVDEEPNVPADHARRRSIDVVVVVAGIASVVYWMRLGSHQWFYIDDVPLAIQAQGWKGLFLPYNGHLSIVPAFIYKVVFELVGFSTYRPLQGIAFVTFAAVGVAVYFATRRRLGSVLAGAIAMALLWPSGVHLNVGSLNHYMALTGGVACAWLLCHPTSRSNTKWLAAALVFSLCCADGGVAVAVACLVYCLCTRAPWRRWLASGLPLVGWLLWWALVAAPRSDQSTRNHLSIGSQLHSTGMNFLRSFISLGFGNVVLTVAVILVFLVRTVQVARRGLAESANMLAWVAAFAVWWGGVIWMRGNMATLGQFRYTYFASVLLVLAMVPIRPVVWPKFERVTVRRPAGLARSFAGVAVVALLGFGFMSMQLKPLRIKAAYMNSAGRQARVQASMAMLGPAVVPDDYRMGLWFYGLSAAKLRAVGKVYGGMPVPDARTEAAALDLVKIRTLPESHEVIECPEATMTLSLPGGTYLVTSSHDVAMTHVKARLPGMPWLHLHSLPSNRVASVKVPQHLAPLPLEVRSLSGGIEVSRVTSRGHAECVS